MSQPNNNHNPNNKTIITVVGLRKSYRWEHHHTPTNTHHHTNSKLHDRTEKERNSKEKVISLYEETQKLTPKLSQNQKSELKEL